MDSRFFFQSSWFKLIFWIKSGYSSWSPMEKNTLQLCDSGRCWDAVFHQTTGKLEISLPEFAFNIPDRIKNICSNAVCYVKSSKQYVTTLLTANLLKIKDGKSDMCTFERDSGWCLPGHFSCSLSSLRICIFPWDLRIAVVSYTIPACRHGHEKPGPNTVPGWRKVSLQLPQGWEL